MKKLLGIGFIWLGCAIAWVILGTTIISRSGGMSSSLLDEVHLLWGPPGVQQAPTATYSQVEPQRQLVTVTENGRQVEREELRQVVVTYPVALTGTDAHAALTLDQRRKGLLWFATYGADLQATYTFTNPTNVERDVTILFPLEQRNAIFDAFHVTDDKGQPLAASFNDSGASFTTRFAPNQKRSFTISYRSRGTDTWRYELTRGTGEVRNFKMTVDTTFPEVDFPPGTLSPSTQEATASGWHGAWRFDSLVANATIGMSLPQKLNPGDLAAKITFFAPVGLLFFFFVVAVLSTAARKEIHPLNYFLFGCAFFAFHLLFAYLVDHVAVGPAFAISSAVSIFLVVTYARLFVGWRFALREMALSQLIYLVLFSFTFFWTGFTGLAITIGAILTLFVVMQITGRVSWREVMQAPPQPTAATR
ncbi:MAG: inner membrane CreD family protein [Deltaproteobacteria bacterium]|nr:inner membrane CreD family protein [Deltaproteobacteria bacterium]